MNYGDLYRVIELNQDFIKKIDKYKTSINRKTKSAITIYCINSTLRTISFDEISEYTVRAKRVIKIDININAENLLK